MGFAGLTDLTETTDPQSACPVLTLPRVAEDLPAMIPRRSLRKAWNRVQRRTGIDLIEATFATVHNLIESLIDLHRQRWTARHKPGVLGTQEVQRFHREAAPRLLAAEMLRLLRAQDCRAASLGCTTALPTVGGRTDT